MLQNLVFFITLQPNQYKVTKMKLSADSLHNIEENIALYKTHVICLLDKN